MAHVSVGVRGGASLHGSVPVVADPDLIERTLLLAALAEGRSVLRIGRAPACLEPSLAVLGQLGVVAARAEPGVYELWGRGLAGLKAPDAPLDVSGAPVLGAGLLGALVGQPFESRLGPFEASEAFTRDLEALGARGARVALEDSWCRLGPLTGALRGQQVQFSSPSPMSKHLLLVSGLFADAETTIVERLVSADHTERLLDALGAPIRV